MGQKGLFVRRWGDEAVFGFLCEEALGEEELLGGGSGTQCESALGEEGGSCVRLREALGLCVRSDV